MANAGRRPPHSGPQPKVTGLSPNEGPPGTKITIRGENLGVSPEDVIGLTICDVDVLIYADWKSPSKILTRSGKCKGQGDIIVTTNSGGRGTCTVQFRGYEEIVSPTKESAIWVNEDDAMATLPRHRSASSPSIYHQDPLGIIPEDDSGELYGRRLSVEQIRDMFGDAVADDGTEESNIASEKFIPTLYLLKHHARATFSDLKAGLESLRQRTATRDDFDTDHSQLSLLKPNVLAVIECLDALKAVHISFKKEKQEYGPDLTHKIEDAIKKATEAAHDIFDGILSRKDLADSTRNALNVLQRYRFLFNLPSSIEKNIQKGDYEPVISDYSRARSLFADTQVKVFKRVYDEVVQRMAQFKVELQEKLTQSCKKPEPKNTEEMKKLIKHLISLDVPGNPAWDAIVTIRDTLVESMTACREKHIARLQAKKGTKIFVEGDSPIIDSFSADSPQAVQFIEEVTTIFNKVYPDLVKLGQDYLNGDLFTKEIEEQFKLKEQIFQTEMVQQSISTLVSLMRGALLPQSVKTSATELWPEDSAETFVVWLPHCLRCVINCYHSLVKHEHLVSSSNSNALQQVQKLIFDFRVHALNYLFGQASDEVRSLCTKENWDVSCDDSIGTRTQLPLLFESKVIEIIQLVRETILQTTSADEVDIFKQIPVQGQMKQLAQTLMTSFIETLEKTINNQATSPTTTLKSNPSYEERILMVICNCTFTTNYVMPRLKESFDKYNYPDMNMVMDVTQAKFRDCENKLFEKYIERKCDSVIGAIEPSLYLAGQKWFAPHCKPADVSFYIKETLVNIIDVQAQIFSLAPALVRKIMIHVIDSSIEEISRLHECVADDFTDLGNLQALIDFSALKAAFTEIESNSTEKLLESSCSHLKPISGSDDKASMDRILNQFRQAMHLQLYCFRWDTDQPVMII
ncbi:Exocyst complex component 2 [Halotydeus destructor]|nr:Exocyst complex component 2 [Halotydeus destructor]